MWFAIVPQYAMADKAPATVQMDQNGRVFIPASTRKALDIHGESADLDLDVTVLNRHGENDE